MLIEADELLQIMPNARSRVGQFLVPLSDAMEEWGIHTGHRMAMFLAQIAHESGELRYVRELATGEAYEGRADLGNTEQGDGVRFKGRGLIQLTGRDNYQALSDWFAVDFVTSPVLLESPEWACRSAGWYWCRRGCNAIADIGTEDAFRQITRKINGGYNGWDARVKYWTRANKTLGV